jgi:uncharacterized phage protein (TIGR02220 family)
MILSNEIVSQTIRYLNEHTKVQFSTNQPLIEKLINEGYGFDEFKAVIDKKYNDWKGTKFIQFIILQFLSQVVKQRKVVWIWIELIYCENWVY